MYAQVITPFTQIDTADKKISRRWRSTVAQSQQKFGGVFTGRKRRWEKVVRQVFRFNNDWITVARA
jgi:hypothetical protein